LKANAVPGNQQEIMPPGGEALAEDLADPG
jgi:hypothetical protein